MNYFDINLKPFVLIALISSSCSTPLQRQETAEQETVFKFETNDESLANRNFAVRRTFINDSVFVDKGILCNDTSSLCDIRFCNSKIWKVWTGKNWATLFDKNGKVNRIDFVYTKKTIKPLEPYILGSDTLYAFSCRDETVGYSGDYTEYLLSKSDGIVIVKNEMTFFTRTDYNNNNLNILKQDHFK